MKNKWGIWEKDSQGNAKKPIYLFEKNGSFGEGENKVTYSTKGKSLSLKGDNINIDQLPEGLKLIYKQNDPFFSLKISDCNGSFHLGKDDNMNLEFDKNFKPKLITVKKKKQPISNDKQQTF